MAKKTPKPETARQLLDHLMGVYEHCLEQFAVALNDGDCQHAFYHARRANHYAHVILELAEDGILPEDLDRRAYVLRQAAEGFVSNLKEDCGIDPESVLR
jgi:hypothetical protein